MTKKNITANEAWKLIFDKYPIIDDISKHQYYIIQADKIKEFKEPRLMSKWDSSTSLPEIFKQNKINMLSNSRSSYILGRFDLYEELPIFNENKIVLQKVEVPQYETIDIENISSEANALNRTGIKSYDKYYEPNAIPFIQANSFERVIALFENLYNTPMNKAQIASLMEFDERQSDYYFNAGKYLGLFFKNDKQEVELTALANQMLKMKYKERQLKFVELILSHKIFNDFFKKIHRTGIFPTTKEINHYLVEEEICKQSNTAERRSSSVKAWLSWIFDLVKYE